MMLAAEVKHPNPYLCSQVFYIPALNSLGIALVYVDSKLYKHEEKKKI